MIERPFRNLAVGVLTVSLTTLTACSPASPPLESTEAAAPPIQATPGTISGTPTPDLPSLVMSLAEPVILGSFPSPDGSMTAEVTVFDCVTLDSGETIAYDVLEIVEADGGTRSVAASQLQYCGGLGAYGLQGIGWSPSSRYFYFTDARTGVPDGGCGPWPGSKLRVDVRDGEVQAMGGAVASPDGSMFASLVGEDLEIWPIDAAEVVRFPSAVPGAANGPIGWSPDGQSLVYIQTAEACPPWGTSTVVLHRLGASGSQVIVESEEPAFIQAEWVEAGRLRLLDAAGGAWTYDLATDHLTPEG
jgi:hypothetical protein